MIYGKVIVVLESEDGMDEEDFASWLNRQLKERNLSVTSVAAQAGVSQGYLSMLRQGRRARASRRVVGALADALGAEREEAFRAAALPIDASPTSNERPHPLGEVPRFHSVSDQRLRSDTRKDAELGRTPPDVNDQPIWNCKFTIRDMTLAAEARWAGENTSLVSLSLSVGAAQAAMTVPLTESTIVLSVEDCLVYCDWSADRGELVIRLPIPT